MKFLHSFLFLTGLVLFATCKEDDNISDWGYPRLETQQVISGPDGLLFSGKITMRGNHQILSHGFVWSASPDPRLEKSFKVVFESEPQHDVFSQEIISGFHQNKPHYVRAFLQTPDYMVYGPEVEFKPNLNGTTLVDIDPIQANIGETITISGFGFEQLPSDFKIFFDDVQAEITSLSGTQVQVTVPAGLIQNTNVEVKKLTTITIHAPTSTLFTLSPNFELYYPGKWTRLNNFPGDSRNLASSFMIGNSGYFGFGSSRNCPATTYYSDLWKYDQTADSWREIATPLTGRAGVTTIVRGTKAYVIGGHHNQTRIKEVWEFDATSENWTRKTDFPGTARALGFGFAIDDHAYYGGGYRTFNECLGGDYDHEFWRYDLLNDAWEKLNNLPFSSLNGVGVSNSTSGFTLASSTVLYEFDPDTNSWHPVSQGPFWTLDQVKSAIVDDVISFGSTHLPEEHENLYFEFDLLSKQWVNRTFTSSAYAEVIGTFKSGEQAIVLVSTTPFNTLEVWRLED
jgi:hypothetical protein